MEQRITKFLIFALHGMQTWSNDSHALQTSSSRSWNERSHRDV